MAGDEGIRDGAGPRQDGAVGAADAHRADLDDHIGVPQDRIGDLFDGKAGAKMFFHNC